MSNMSQPETSNPRSTKKTHRQISKPMMERRRRARINGCLGELRSMLLQSNTTQSCRRSKLEKADILEMTVRHLKALSNRSGTVTDANVPHIFCAGYTDCARDVGRFLSSSDGIHHEVRAALLHRLSDRAAALADRTQQTQYSHRVPFVRCTPLFPDDSAPTSDLLSAAILPLPVVGQALTLSAVKCAFSSQLRKVVDPGSLQLLTPHRSPVTASVAKTAPSEAREPWRPW